MQTSIFGFKHKKHSNLAKVPQVKLAVLGS